MYGLSKKHNLFYNYRTTILKMKCIMNIPIYFAVKLDIATIELIEYIEQMNGQVFSLPRLHMA